MKQRLPYLIAFCVLLIGEICIGLYVHDRFVRPYLGDVLVTVLLCCFARVFWPKRPKWLALWVFLFSALVEGAQALGLAERLGLSGTVLGVILGATFDWADLLCYFFGCLLFFLTESFIFKKADIFSIVKGQKSGHNSPKNRES